VAILAGAVVVLGCGWLWFRDSSLVSINRVKVTGLSGPNVGAIRTALIDSALAMTTLDVDIAKLRSAVSAYPDVRSLDVSTSLPHDAVIAVDEEIPVAVIAFGGRRIAISAAGLLLRPPVASDGRLPSVALAGGATENGRIVGPAVRAELRVLGAAPFRVLSQIARASETAAHGIVVKLRNGPSVYFGPEVRLAAKWAAAIAVLGDSTAAGAQYIDVTDPEHPAAGASTSGTGVAGTTSTTAAGAAGTTSTTATAPATAAG
jgi:cell division septal protein FtsQ